MGCRKVAGLGALSNQRQLEWERCAVMGWEEAKPTQLLALWPRAYHDPRVGQKHHPSMKSMQVGIW